MTTDALGAEIARVNDLSRQMIDEYVAWGDKIRIGEIQQAMYDEILDFVNFRIETAETCLNLIDSRRVADSLGLSRSLLEHYLLLMLMCQGRKLFRLQDLSQDMTDSEFKKYVKEQQEKLKELHAAGEAPALLEIRSYPRAKRHAAYVYEGVTAKDEPDFFIPRHFFAFQDFRPEAMRLKADDYFRYYPPDSGETAAERSYQAEARYTYKHYLSYDALVYSLELNGLVDSAARTRLEAHYTFLGKYLHPSFEAARELHEQSNYYDGGTAVGLGQRYTGTAALLASLYVCYSLAGLLNEAAGLHERAPKKYIADAGTASLRALTARVPEDFPYFWFLFNDAPLYDRYNHAMHHVNDEDLAAYGGYEGVPSDLVAFDQYIYGHLESALRGWNNARCGEYRSPLESR